VLSFIAPLHFSSDWFNIFFSLADFPSWFSSFP
jgi:hypothetical protein